MVDLDEGARAALGDRLLGLTISVEELSAMPVASIATAPARALVRLVLGMLRDARTLSTAALLERWREVIVEVAREAGRAALHAIVQYVSEVHEIEDVAELARMARLHAGSEMEDAVTTWIDKVRAEGEAEGEARGRAEGEARGRAEAVLKLLTLKFGPLSPSTIERVRRANLEELDRFTERVLTAETVEEVLA